jgi:hypothetical protein
MRYPFDVVYPITQVFGENPGRYDKWEMIGHNGIDFGCPLGTRVLAADRGAVRRAEFDAGGYGYYVEVAHLDGISTVYGHLSQIMVARGAVVNAGDCIGLSGSTGNSTGPHLHFEVRKQGEEHNGYCGAIDPAPLIAWPATPTPATPEAPSLKPGEVRVNVAGLNVRLAPGLDGKIIGMVQGGTIFERVADATTEKDGYHWLPVVVYVAQEMVQEG